MDCRRCRYLGDNCGGLEGKAALPTVDPGSLTSRELLEIACALARVGTVLCDIGQGNLAVAPDDEPYIWDQEDLGANH